MSRVAHRVLRALARLAIGFAVQLLTVWGALALWYQMPQPSVARGFVVAIWSSLGVPVVLPQASLLGRQTRNVTGFAFVVATAFLLMWRGTLHPSHQRVWADDVAQLLEARIDGNHVHLKNVRNFEWRSETDYTPLWESRTYDLDRLRSADLVLSYWMGPHIAHTLVSFGFDGGERVVFSLEIRKERHESFSAIGGFFRQFEQVLVAADERDIVRTRSNARGEDVYLRQLPESQNKLSPYPRAHRAKAKKSLNFCPFLEGWLFTDLRRPAAHKFQKSTAYRDHHKLQTACDEQKSQKTGIFIARTFCAEVRSA